MAEVEQITDVSKEKAAEEIFQFVTFNIGQEKFAVDILKVKEIIRMVDITKVPNTPEFIDGVFNLRGKVIPIINIRTRFKIPTISPDKNTRIIVVQIETKTVGFIVDSVNEVLRLPSSVIKPPPDIITGIDSKFITSVGIWDNQMIIILDLYKILTNQEQEALI